MQTDIKIINLSDTEIIYRVVKSIIYEGELFVKSDTYNLQNTDDSVAFIKENLPEPYLTQTLSRWGSDEIVSITKQDIADNPVLLFVLPETTFPEYDVNEKRYEIGDIFTSNGVKYLVKEPFISSNHITPHYANSRNLMHPFKSLGLNTWAHGETIPLLGIQREYEGVVYINKLQMTSEQNRITPDFNSDFWQALN